VDVFAFQCTKKMGLFDDGVGAEEAAQGRPMGSNKKDRREPVFFVIVSPPGWAMFA